MGTVHAKETDFKKNSDDLYLSSVKARVDNVQIEGLNWTKNDVVKASVTELFASQDIEEMILNANKVQSKLESLGCFKKIGIFIDVSKGPKASPDGYDVTFSVKEQSRIIGGINTMAGNDEGFLVVSIKMPNVAGRGEKLQCEYSRGSKGAFNLAFTATKPYPYKKFEPVLSASLLQQYAEFPWSRYNQLDRGCLFDIGFKTGTKTFHNLQYEALFRDLLVTKNTAFPVREAAGPKMKSTIRHIVAVDKRDDAIFPTVGNLVKFTSEVAGLGGSMAFLKNDLFLQSNFTIAKDIVLQGALEIGLLNDFHDTNITENFFIGGPQNIRGFQMRGIGPQSEGCSLGSNWLYPNVNVKGMKFYWASGLHLYTPLPFRPGRGGIGDLFRTHFFLNAGNIGPVKRDQDTEKNLEAITKNVRLSTGLGIALRIGSIARLELNYCFPLWHTASDVPVPGIQYGIGVNFL